MTRVLVTGATGFVGGRLAHVLRERGDDVVALVRTPSGDLARGGVEQVVGDLGALGQAEVGLVSGHIEVVVHAATSMDPDLEVARAVNQAGTAALAQLARHHDARFVHISTTAVYDLPAIGDAEVDERAPLLRTGSAAPATSSSSSTYAVTKAEAEIEVARLAADGHAVTVLRPPAVLGAGPTSTWGQRIPTQLRDRQWRPPHPDTTMAWVHVDDLVEAIIAAIDRPLDAKRETTLGTARETTLNATRETRRETTLDATRGTTPETGREPTPEVPLAAALDATVHVIGGHTTFGAYVDALAEIVPGIGPDAATSADRTRRWQGRYTTDRLPELLGITPQRNLDDAIAEIARWWSSGSAG